MLGVIAPASIIALHVLLCALVKVYAEPIDSSDLGF